MVSQDRLEIRPGDELGMNEQRSYERDDVWKYCSLSKVEEKAVFFFVDWQSTVRDGSVSDGEAKESWMIDSKSSEQNSHDILNSLSAVSI